MWFLQCMAWAETALSQAWSLGLSQMKYLGTDLVFNPLIEVHPESYASAVKHLKTHPEFPSPVICTWHAGTYVTGVSRTVRAVVCANLDGIKEKNLQNGKPKILIVDRIFISTEKLRETWQNHISPLWIFWHVLCFV